MRLPDNFLRVSKASLKTVYRHLPGKAALFSELKRFWIPEFYRRLQFNGPFTVRIDPSHAFRMQHYDQYGIETEIFWKGLDDAWESVSIFLWKQLIRPGALVLDIGANQGLYALITKCLCPSARVLAFEPLPSAFLALQANVALNNFNIECLEIALADFDGEAKFYSPATNLATEGSLIASEVDQANLKVQRVRAGRLASLIETHCLAHVDLMKIDVEGAEAGVLSGMGSYLRQFRPAILVEVLRDGVGSEIEGLMRGLDYVYLDINDDPRNGPLGWRQVDHIKKATCLNYFLLPREQAMPTNFIAGRDFELNSR